MSTPSVDIVERLRYVTIDHSNCGVIMREAADEIERLRAELAEARQREKHVRNRIWLAMVDIADGQAMQAWSVLQDLYKEIEASLERNERTT